MTAQNNTAKDRDFVLTRVFDAPRDLVWKVWTEPEHMAQWLSPTGSMRAEKMEFRPGGTFHYCMQTPDGQDMWGRWIFREIKAPEKIVLINSFSDAEGNIARHPMSATWPREMLSTSIFQEQGDKTVFTLTWSPYNATLEEIETFDAARPGMEQGWGISLGQLDAYLVKISGGR